jgi:TonB family protein
MAPVAPFVAAVAEPELKEEPAPILEEKPAIAHVSADPFAPVKELPSQEEIFQDLDDGARKSLVQEIALGVRKQVGLHPAAYVLIAIAFGFGVTGAIVLFTRDQSPAPPPTIQVVTVTAPSLPGAAPTEIAPADSVAMNTDTLPVARQGGGTSRPIAGGDSAKTQAEEPVKTDSKGTATPRVGLGNGPAIDGPSLSGPGQGSGSNLPSELDQSDIERVVASQRASVRRACWDSAIAERSSNTPKSAKVTVSISIAPSGNVSNASATGGDGYPGLASCVAQRVRTWKFPPSAGTSRATIPFSFVVQ